MRLGKMLKAENRSFSVLFRARSGRKKVSCWGQGWKKNRELPSFILHPLSPEGAMYLSLLHSLRAELDLAGAD